MNDGVRRAPGLTRQVLTRVLPPVLVALVVVVLVVAFVDRRAVRNAAEAELAQVHARAVDLVTLDLLGVQRQVRALADIDLLRTGLIDTQERYRYLPALFESVTLVAGADVDAHFSLNDFLGEEIIGNGGIDDTRHLLDIGDPTALEAGRSIFIIDADGLFYAHPVRIGDFVEGSVEVSLDRAGADTVLASWNDVQAASALVGPDGTVLYANDRWTSAFGLGDPGDGDVRAAASTLEEAGLADYAVRTVLPPPSGAGVLTRQNLVVVSVGFVALAVIVFGVVGAAALTGRTVRSFSAELDRIVRDPDPTQRLSQDEGPRELRELAQTFNRTLAALSVAEEERVARLAAEASNRSKSVFLANMSHEIRTPLNAVIGFAQLLEFDDGLSEKQREQVRAIARSGEHLLALINEVLDLSKIEAGRTEVVMGIVPLHEMIDDLTLMFEQRAEAKGLRFVVEVFDEVPTHVVSDDAKVRQILVNLIGNAVKFTSEGGVAVRVAARGDADGPTLVVEVEDSGPGLSAAEQAVVFDAFQQTEAGDREGGTGLGLAITHGLVELLRGTIRIDSQRGHGALFRVEIPVDVAPAPGAAVEDPVVRGGVTWTGRERLVDAQQGTRVLSVDDRTDNRTVIRAMLEPLGFVVRDAVDGREGVEAFESWQPDVVLMDMRMPEMDGYEATRRIKATRRGAETPVIAVTASAFGEDEQRVLEVGVDGFVRKPFRRAELLDALVEAAGAEFEVRSGDTAPTAASDAVSNAVSDVVSDGTSAADAPTAPSLGRSEGSEEASGASPRSAEAGGGVRVGPVLDRLGGALAEADTAALDIVDASRDELLAAFGPAGRALIDQVRAFDFDSALATVRELRATIDPPR